MQKIKELEAVKTVRVMKQFENSTNPYLFQHATLCEIWEESMKQAQEMEKTALMDHRKAMCVDSSFCHWLHSINVYSIMERVKTLGWADELSKMNSFARRLEDDSHIEKICQKDVTARGNAFNLRNAIFSHKP